MPKSEKVPMPKRKVAQKIRCQNAKWRQSTPEAAAGAIHQ
jgi:hypothetical protein